MYKLIKPLKESGKMAVTTEQSECLQNALFEMGYSWAENDASIKNTNSKHIFWAGYNKRVGHSLMGESFFNRQPEPLHKFEDYFEQ